jgi:serine/threonine-protein kinase
MPGPRDPQTGPAHEEAFAPTMVGVAGASSASSSPSRVDAGEMPLEDAGFAVRYQERALLGQGGMGDVHACRDQRIGREVAVKVARPTSGPSRADQVARFAREARVQGQLEHPAIVPVYDLGRRPDGAVYFTMKRVRGATLEKILDGLRRGDEATVKAYSRRKLLTAFGSVCQAVHFAHTRGVLHRDLKPGNVMLGDYGEVYVLDWGLAKLVGEADDAPVEGAARAARTPAATPAPVLTPRVSRLEVASTPGPATTSGSVMGTPGYMAPEQLRGEIERLDARADVYALGALLFELLTYEPLHPRRSSAETMRSTLDGADARASTRAPGRDVPPELEAVCVRATALAPADRFASARELVEAVERFLDGDRDLERRHELAVEAARAAGAAADRALAGGTPAEAEANRRAALAHAGHALALEPENAAAMRTMIRLLLAPPAILPAEVERDLERGEQEMVRVASVKGGWTFLSWFLFVPFLFWMGVRDVVPLVVWLVLVGASAALGFFGARARYSSSRLHVGGLIVSYSSIVLLSALFGPFVLVPIMASVNTVVLLLHSRPTWRAVTMILGVLAALVPVLADQLGWWPRTTTFADDALVIHSWMAHLPPTATLIALTSVMVGAVLIPAIYVLRVRDSLTTAERNLHLQSWHLRQLIPAEARDALVPAPATYASPLIPCPLDPAK